MRKRIDINSLFGYQQRGHLHKEEHERSTQLVAPRGIKGRPVVPQGSLYVAGGSSYYFAGTMLGQIASKGVIRRVWEDLPEAMGGREGRGGKGILVVMELRGIVLVVATVEGVEARSHSWRFFIM